MTTENGDAVDGGSAAHDLHAPRLVLPDPNRLTGDRRIQTTQCEYRGRVHPDDWDSLLALIDVDNRDAAAIIRVDDGEGGQRLIEHHVIGRTRAGDVVLDTVDVTERERALHRAARTDRYWRTLLRRSTESITTIDPDSGRLRDGNDQLAELLGLPLEEIVGCPVHRFVDRRDLAELRRPLKRGGETYELRVRNPVRGPIWVEAVVTDATADDDIRALIVNVRDITDRKRVEEQLRASAHLFRTLVENLADGAVVVDSAGVVLHASAATAETLGMGPDLLGATLRIVRDGTGRYRLVTGPVGEALLPALPVELVEDGGRVIEAMVHDLTDVPAVEGHLVIFRDVTAQRRDVEKLRREAAEDSLTGLLNRRGFEEAIRELIVSRNRVAIGFLDLDGFKDINDTHGHSTGDALLVEVAQRLSGAMRPEDLVARFGGDEFVVAFSVSGGEEALVNTTARVVASVQGSHRVGELDLPVVISAGWSVVSDVADLEEALGRADRRMYVVKQRIRA